MTGYVFKLPSWCRPRLLLAVLIVVASWLVVGLVFIVTYCFPGETARDGAFDFLLMVFFLGAAILTIQRALYTR